MEKVMIELINNYINVAQHFVKVMLKDFKVTTKEEFIIQKNLYQTGKLIITSDYDYVFHGRGCRIVDKDGKILVDWDFGFGDQWVGINPGLFTLYINGNNYEYLDNNMYEYNDVLKVFKEMTDKKILYKKLDLYYLSK